MRLLSFRACLLAFLLLLTGCSSVQITNTCDPFEPPNCLEHASFVVVHPT